MIKNSIKNNKIFDIDLYSNLSFTTKNFEWLLLATKDFLIDYMIKKKWTSQTKTELQKQEVGHIRQMIQGILMTKKNIKEIQKLEETIVLNKKEKINKRDQTIEHNRQKKEQALTVGKEYFIPNNEVWIFDERPSDKVFCPIKGRVVKQKQQGKQIIVEILQNRPWYEAGGHPVYKGQEICFYFEPVTSTWLREGLTAEVVRTIGSNGRSRYFELSYTRQYLLLPTTLK